jgi:single-stranded DNA-binding protein
MKKIRYKGDVNLVEITGTITFIEEYVRYIPRPVISCDIVSNRARKNVEEELKTDTNRFIIFDDEDFHKNFQVGDRIKAAGELQSRNYTRFSNEISDLVKIAIQNYVDIWKEIPAIKKPEGKFRQPIDWSKLLQFGLLNEVPEDSMYNEQGEKRKSQASPYIYRIDENGEVFKESEHVSYEIVVTSYERVESEVEPLFGDLNEVTLCGPVTRHPHFDMLGNSSIPFASFTLQSESEFFGDRAFYNNVIAWAFLAEEVLSNVRVGTYVMVKGRLQSRTYKKEIIRRWVTPSGNKKRKKLELEFITREVSASKIFLSEKKENEK